MPEPSCFHIDWPEPYGLVMIEAMTCGTPVVAFDRGSVPEIIEDSLTGYIVGSVEEALEKLPQVLALDRRRIRAEFERRFSANRMARDYVSLYQMILGRHARLPRDVPVRPTSEVSSGEAVS